MNKIITLIFILLFSAIVYSASDLLPIIFLVEDAKIVGLYKVFLFFGGWLAGGAWAIVSRK